MRMYPTSGSEWSSHLTGETESVRVLRAHQEHVAGIRSEVWHHQVLIPHRIRRNNPTLRGVNVDY